MSLNLAGETMAADPASDPGGDEIRRADSTMESAQEFEFRKSSETIVEERSTVMITETKVEVSASEIKTTGDVQGEGALEDSKEKDSSLAEGRHDPTELSLDDLTGGLDMEGKPTGEELEEGEMEASEEKEMGSGHEQEVRSLTETDPVQVSEETVGEVKNDGENQVTESKSTGEELGGEVLEGSVAKETGLVEGIQEKETTGEESNQQNEAGEIKDDGGENQVMESKSTGEVLKQEVLEGSVDGMKKKETTGEGLEQDSEAVGEIKDDQNQVPESKPTGEALGQEVLEGSDEGMEGKETTGEVLEGPVNGDNLETQIIVEEQKKDEATETQPLEKTDTEKKVLEEGVESPAVTSNPDSEKVLEEGVEAPAVTSNPDSEAMEIASQVDLNCRNSEIGEIERESESIWGNEPAGEDSRNELTVHDFIMVEAKEVGESSVEAGPTFAEIQSNIELGEITIEENNTKTVGTNPESKEAVVYHRREKHTTKPAPTGPDLAVAQTPTEEELPIKYSLPSIDKGGFVNSDLVWGKVKSHPWWPGLIISPSDASNLAMKYQKRDSFLVAYFGDKTFAWCEESQLKPFFPNFSHFVKLVSSDAFNNAVKSVLSEVSRRFEVGTICSCLDEKSYATEVYPKIENAGVKQGFGNCAVSRDEIMNYFNSEGIVSFVKNLALDPFKGTNDRLGLVTVTSLIKSIYRSKGYSIPPKYRSFGPLEDYIEPSKSEELRENAIIGHEVNNTTPITATTLAVTPSTSIFTPVILPNKSSNTVKDVIIDPPPKRKRGRPPKKKKEEMDTESQKPLSELVHKKSPSSLSNGSKSNNKPEKALLTWDDDSASLPWKRQKPIVDFDFVDQDAKSLTPASGFGMSFKIGACISRAASRITGSGSGSSPVITVPKFDRSDFDVSSDEETTTPKEGYYYTEEKRERKRRLKKYHYSDPEEILSQLCLLATSPMKQYVFLGNVIGYFTDFRKFIVPVSELEPGPSVPVSGETGTVPEKVKLKRGRKRKVDLGQVQTEEGLDNQLQDSYWSDMILSGQTEDPSVWPKVYKRRASVETKGLNLTGTDAKRALVLLAASKRPVIRVEEKRLGECNPTALILNFSTRYGPVPAETDLVRIFSRYGALKGEIEKEMEGSVSKVKVVFKRRADADMAFGSLRKENVFGPALLSYRLLYLSELEKKGPVPNGEHPNLHMPAPEENIGLTSGAQGDDVSEMPLYPSSTVEAMETGVISMDQSSTVETEAKMVTEMSNEIPTEPSIMVQGENVDEVPTDLTSTVQNESNVVTERPNEPSSIVQSEAQMVTEISNEDGSEEPTEPSIMVQDEGVGEENKMDQSRDEGVEMEIYGSIPVQDGGEIRVDAPKTMQEEKVGGEGSINPLEEGSMQDEIENQKPVYLSESDTQAQIENEKAINPSEMKNEEPVNINPSESSMQGEMKNEEPININPPESSVQGEMKNEKINDPAGAEGGDVAEMSIDQPNTEEGEISGEIAVDPPSDKGLDDEKPEQGEIFGNEESSDEPEQGEIVGDEELRDEPEQGEIVGEEELVEKPEQGLTTEHVSKVE